MELAGFFAAHAIWCVSDGSTLTPMLAYETSDGSRELHRLVMDRIEDAVVKGREWLETNPAQAVRAVLVYDGFITLQTGKTDALLVEGRLFQTMPQSFIMAVPYRHASSPNGFAVYRPKFLSFTSEPPSRTELATAFFRGVEKHEKGAAVWNQHLDASR